MVHCLNSAIDLDNARLQLAADSYTVIPEFLEPGFANALAQELLDFSEWNLVFRDNDRHYDLHRDQWTALSKENYGLLKERVLAVGRLQFQYFYYNLPLYDLVALGRPLSPCLDKLYQFLESREFIATMQTVTDNARVDFADYQATKYTAGCFLKTHNDYVAGKNRHAAYVLSLTPDWNPDWGGLLTFPSTDGSMGRYMLPHFNRLYVFSVPQPHSVSMVTDLAMRPRLGITGWLRSR